MSPGTAVSWREGGGAKIIPVENHWDYPALSTALYQFTLGLHFPSSKRIWLQIYSYPPKYPMVSRNVKLWTLKRMITHPCAQNLR